MNTRLTLALTLALYLLQAPIAWSQESTPKDKFNNGVALAKEKKYAEATEPVNRFETLVRIIYARASTVSSATSALSFTARGGLIQTASGSAGGVGRPRTKRSG